MQMLLATFGDVFQEPSGLLPIGDMDHCILLKDGTEPINVRSYKYAHFQKYEIEKQVVQDLLSSEFIRPSTNSFSSLVLLVKKKWQLTFLHELSCT